VVADGDVVQNVPGQHLLARLKHKTHALISCQ
jgi:hypothetical protein